MISASRIVLVHQEAYVGQWGPLRAAFQGASTPFPRPLGHAGNVTARPTQAGHETEPDRVDACFKDDRNCRAPLGPSYAGNASRQSRHLTVTRSATKAGSRSIGPPPSGIQSPRFVPRRNRFRSVLEEGRQWPSKTWREAPLINPITGIAVCCARARAAITPRTNPVNAMNSRRFIGLVLGLYYPIEPWVRAALCITANSDC